MPYGTKPSQTMQLTSRSTLASRAYSDLTIACQDSILNVHKVIVCSQSDFFDKAVNFSAGKVSMPQVTKPLTGIEPLDFTLRYFIYPKVQEEHEDDTAESE